MATAHSHVGQAVGEHTPSLGGRLPRPASTRRVTPSASTAWTWCSAPCRTASPSGWCPSSGAAVGRRRRPGRRLPVARCRRSTRVGTARSTVRPSCWPKRSTGCPSSSARTSPAPRWWPRRGATRPRPAWRSAPWCVGGLVEPDGIVVDAASGVSGAGRGLKESLHFGTVDEDFTAYGLLTHRHTPEIEQILGAEVLFTPHLAPMVARHPGHLLRPAGRRRSRAVDGRGHGRPPRGLRRRALRGRHRRPARRPRPRRGRTPHTSRRASTPAPGG